MKPEEQLQEEKGLRFSKSKLFFYIFAAIIFVGSIYYFSQIKGSIALFRQIRPAWLVVAIAAQIGTYFFGATVFERLLRTFQISFIRVKELFQASIVMLFINQTIPTVGVSGHMFFFNFLKKRGVSEDRALPLILTELLTFYSAIIGIIIVLVLLCALLPTIPSLFAPILFAGIAVYAVLAMLVGLLGRGSSVLYILKKISRISFLKKAIDQYETFSFSGLKSPWRAFREHPTIVAESIFFQVCIFLCDSITILALFRGVNIHVPFLFIMLGFMVTLIIALLPISPGALIVYEGSMTFFYVSLGVPLAAAGIVTILYRVLSFWAPIPLGFFLYRKLQLSD
ncbi:MAG TPA: lysylphosphatidylglycerol synthase transmembrane domain-containing protein [Candidatus Paceibacterota bacterium]|nr:lysylphosphatidylglycerol synthase transmembrane domain-containing protein [Candidatus Paceibacterota bacterium]